MFERLVRGRAGRVLSLCTLVWTLAAYTVAPVSGAFGATGVGGSLHLTLPKLQFPVYEHAARTHHAVHHRRAAHHGARSAPRHAAPATRTVVRRTIAPAIARPVQQQSAGAPVV